MRKFACTAICTTFFGVMFICTAICSTSVGAEELCFSVPEAKRMLKDLEAGKQCLEEYRPAADNVITLDEERIEQLREERDKAVENLKQGDKACEEAVKASQGTWFERARKAGGWVGIGAVIAAVAILLL